MKYQPQTYCSAAFFTLFTVNVSLFQKIVVNLSLQTKDINYINT